MLLTDWDYKAADVLTGVQTFIEETKYGVSYSPSESLSYLWRLYNDPDTAIFVEYREDTFSGFAIVSRDREFQNEYFGFLSKFYVMPNARGTETARNLIRQCTTWFDASECIFSFASATGNVGEDKLFINLLLKFGYKILGTTLTRKQNEQV